MEKRVILAFVLSFAVLYAFSALYKSPPAPKTPDNVAEQPTNAASSASPVTSEQAAPAIAEAPPRPEGNIKAEKPEELQVETPLYIAKFSNVGGVLKSFRLKAYGDGAGSPVELI